MSYDGYCQDNSFGESYGYPYQEGFSVSHSYDTYPHQDGTSFSESYSYNWSPREERYIGTIYGVNNNRCSHKMASNFSSPKPSSIIRIENYGSNMHKLDNDLVLVYNNNSISEITKKEEIIDMSLLTTYIANDGILAVADSRNTTINADGRKTFSDDFQKIIYLPEHKLAIGNTGLNTFDGMSFAEYVTKVSKKAGLCSREQLINMLDSGFNYSAKFCDNTVNIIYFYYECPNYGYALPTVVCKSFAPTSVNNGVAKMTVFNARGREFNFGISVGTEYLKTLKAVPINVQDAKEYLIDVFRDIISLDQKRSDTANPSAVGFPIHSLIIKPDGSYKYE